MSLPLTEDLTPTLCPHCCKKMPADAYNKMYKCCRTCYMHDPDIQKQKAETKARIFAEIDEKYKQEMGEAAFKQMQRCERVETPPQYQCSKCSAKEGHPKFHREGSGVYQKHLLYKM